MRVGTRLLSVLFLTSVLMTPSAVKADTIYGCAHKQNGKLRIVSAPGQCHSSEYELSWESGEASQQLLAELLGRIEAIENALGVINEAPEVHAGDDTSILVSMTLDLQGEAVDDGLVAEMTFYWEHASGPGSAFFTDPYVLLTTVYFSDAGLHTLRLSVNDGYVTISDDINIQVYPDNSPPTIIMPEVQIVGARWVYRGGHHEMLCEPITLDAQVNDDGLPLPLTYEWVVSDFPASGYNFISHASFLSTPADSSDWPLSLGARTVYSYQSRSELPLTLSAALKLSTSDGYWSNEGTMEVVCDIRANDRPQVEAGPDQEIQGSWVGSSPLYGFDCTGVISGTATDDGLPMDLGTGWTVESIQPGYSPYYDVTAGAYSPHSSSTDFRILVRPISSAYIGQLPRSLEVRMAFTASDGFYSSSDQLTLRCIKPAG